MARLPHRRDLLTALGGAALLAGTGAVVPLLRQSSPKRVVVIGAGMAGLAAALRLTEQGHAVTVLEAQSRPGGRVQTDRTGGAAAELGAARISSVHHRTLRYIRQLNLPLRPFYPTEGQDRFRFRGQVITVDRGASPQLDALALSLRPDELARGRLALVRDHLWPTLLQLRDVIGDPWPPPELAHLDTTLAERVAAMDLSPDLAAALTIGVTDPSTDPASALAYIRLIALHSLEHGVWTLDGGMDRLPRTMAAQLGDRLHLDTAVARVEHSPTTARVIAVHQGQEHTWTADHVVVTTPLPTLSRITFDPPLSPERQEAMAAVAQHQVVRIVAAVRERPWRAEGLSGFARTDDPMELWHVTHDRPGPDGVLVGYFKQSGAEALQRLTTREDRIREGLSRMDAVLPGLAQATTHAVAKSWSDDPWAGGAYALWRPGQLSTLPRLLARSEGLLHFAGCHTSPWPGFIEGALHSGHRAARAVEAAG